MGFSHSHRAPSDRFSTVSLDVVSGFPATTTGYDSIFVCLDNFSGRIFLSPCKKTLTSQQAADLFVAKLALPDLPDASDDPEDIRAAIQVHIEAARDALDHMARSTEQQLDQHRRPHRFQVDDLVWLSAANIPVTDSFPKLRPRFIGPFKIILSFISDNTVRLELTDRFRHLEHGTFNIKWLRPHQDRDPNFELSVDRPAPLDTAQGLEYEVEQVLAKRRHGRGIQYLVHWKGYPNPADHSWKAASELSKKSGIRELIRHFESTLPDQAYLSQASLFSTFLTFERSQRQVDLFVMRSASMCHTPEAPTGLIPDDITCVA
eukprot:768490-Hanusia_phi.AAC.1